MKIFTFPRFAPGLAALALLVAPPLTTAAQPRETTAGSLRVQTDLAAGRLTVLHRDRPVLVYAFADHQWKPYVKELWTLNGENVLLDAPPDHLHHHGLMYAIAVNGTNFWEEATAPGVQKPVAPPTVEANSAGPESPRVTIRQPIHWVARQHRHLADTAPVALIEEVRTLTLTVDEANGEVAVRWQGAFTVGRAAPVVTLTGSVYFGLGLRLSRPFDGTAARLNSAGTPYTAPNAGNEATVADWTAMTQTIGGREVTVAVFDQPANAGRSVFFSMLNAFAYISATQELDRAPLTYRQGQTFALDYLVVARSDKSSPDELARRYARWLSTGR
jgi:hypothetical protein